MPKKPKAPKEAWERKAPRPQVALPPLPVAAPPEKLAGRHDINIEAPLSQELTQERWLNALNAVAFFDPRRLTYANGKPRPVNQLDDDTALGLMGVEVEEHHGVGELVGLGLSVTKKYKQADRLKALELIGKHKKWLVDRQEQTGPNGEALAAPQVHVHFQSVNGSGSAA